MAEQDKIKHVFYLLIVGLLAWAIPGAGHFYIRERARGIIIFVTIILTFAVGLYVGSIGVVDPVGAKPWYSAQIMASPAVGMIGSISNQGGYKSFGRCSDIGQIYTSIAGVLNLLCVVSAVYMAYCGRGEMIGTEEEDA